MAKNIFLHEHPDFFTLLVKVSDNMNIPRQLVEKDYWLMHSLWALQSLGLQYELKGGTSLSKGWGIIDRFSEDVDIKIFPPTGVSVASGKNHTKPRHRENRRKYFEWLKSALVIPGVDSVQRDHEFDDHDLRNAGFRICYTSNFEDLPGLKTNVLLEVGFDLTTPNAPKDISSWAYDFGFKNGLEVLDSRALAVPCYLPEYTFVEKLSAISKKYRQEVEGRDVQNFTRHYYDIYQLLGEPRVQAFLGTKEYADYKSSRFGKNDEAEIRNNPAFTLSDISIRSKYSKRLERSSELYFRGQPSIDEILARIALYSDKL